MPQLLTVLIVEDEPFIRLQAAEAFARAGWAVIEAASGEDAMALIGNGRQFDVVFTDIRLRGRLSGWDVGEACRAADASIPVIYASGEPVPPSHRVEPHTFFAKPYDLAEITEVCSRLVRH
jgi:DNA-binding NtrC family response regulator